MVFNLEAFIWYIFLLDSVVAFLMSLLGYENWFIKKFRIFSRYFPLTKGWCTLYFTLILWVGWLYMRLGILPW